MLDNGVEGEPGNAISDHVSKGMREFLSANEPEKSA
jgi:hypothetical protein